MIHHNFTDDKRLGQEEQRNEQVIFRKNNLSNFSHNKTNTVDKQPILKQDMAHEKVST